MNVYEYLCIHSDAYTCYIYCSTNYSHYTLSSRRVIPRGSSLYDILRVYFTSRVESSNTSTVKHSLRNAHYKRHTTLSQLHCSVLPVANMLRNVHCELHSHKIILNYFTTGDTLLGGWFVHAKPITLHVVPRKHFIKISRNLKRMIVKYEPLHSLFYLKVTFWSLHFATYNI